MTLAGLRPGEKLFEEKLMAEEGLKKTKNKLIHIGCPIPFNTEQFLHQLTQIYDEAWQTNRLEINGDKLLDDIYLCKMFCEGSHFLRRNFFKEVPYLPNKYGYEGLPPSLKIWNEGTNATITETI